MSMLNRLRQTSILTVIVTYAALVSLAHASDVQPSLQEAIEKLLASEFAAAHKIAAPIAAAGEPDAQHLIGYIYERGLGVQRDVMRAIDLYARAAAGGHADSQFALGELAFTGAFAKQDDAKAFAWYKRAAENGHTRGQTRLGFMYANGLGVDPDPAKAKELFETAGAAGDPEAQYNLGAIYLSGAGVAVDYKKSAAWFEQAAIQGHPGSQYNLALLYDSPFLGEPDIQKTAKWMGEAAKAGMPAAMVAVGLLTHNGVIEADRHPADWFEAAAELGDAQGKFLYAVALSKGDGRLKDKAEAKRLITEVIALGDELDSDLRTSAAALAKELGA
ncbi:MAG: sel1 repeat family protein [Marinicaulis sp.]|nr:sel1 repeat family protein [Marinicaulis sp.]